MKFSRIETRIFSATAAALLDRDVANADIEPFLDDVAAKAPTHVSWGLRGILWLTWASPIAAARAPKTFTSLARDERAALLAWALDHPSYPVRQLALTAKAMVCLCMLDEPRTNGREGAHGS